MTPNIWLEREKISKNPWCFVYLTPYIWIFENIWVFDCFLPGFIWVFGIMYRKVKKHTKQPKAFNTIITELGKIPVFH